MSNSFCAICRCATDSDIPALAALSHAWRRDNVLSAENGFLRVSYDAQKFRHLLADSNVVVLEVDGAVAGYYLVNSIENDPNLEMHRARVAFLKDSKLLPEQARVALGAQILIDMPFQGKGLRGGLLRYFTNHVSKRYDFLFSTISKDNPRSYRAHMTDGWTVVDQTEHLYFICRPTAATS